MRSVPKIIIHPNIRRRRRLVAQARELLDLYDRLDHVLTHGGTPLEEVEREVEARLRAERGHRRVRKSA